MKENKQKVRENLLKLIQDHEVVHGTQGQSPAQVGHRKQDHTSEGNRRAAELQQSRYYSPPKFCVGDLVRIYKYKKHFEKGYETNFTKEVFPVTEVLHTIPVTYTIEALDGEQIIGSLYSPELVV